MDRVEYLELKGDRIIVYSQIVSIILNMHRDDFPFFKYNDVAYLDNAASVQMPISVIEAMDEYYSKYKANIHRGVYQISETASEKYDETRKIAANFFSVLSEDIIFTSGSTMASNMLVMMLGNYIKKDKYLIISSYHEHHSIALPIIELAKRHNLNIKYIDHSSFKKSESRGIIKNKTLYDAAIGQAKKISSIEPMSIKDKRQNLYDEWSVLLTEEVKIINLTMMSNVTGEIFEVEEIVKAITNICKERSVDRPIIISDMTAIAGHSPVNLAQMGVDAAWCSGHKMCGPTGVGILYIRRDLSRLLSPVIFGGGMVWKVYEMEAQYRSDVQVFEAGTSNIGGVIGLGMSIKYLESVGLKNIKHSIEDLHRYALERLESVPFIKIYSSDSEHNGGIISFVLYKSVTSRDIANIIHPHDVAQTLSDKGVAVRSGHHCAQIYMKYIDEVALTRMSIYFYNTKDEVDRLVNAIHDTYLKFSK